MPDFEITTSEKGGVTFVRVVGFLDAHTFERMQEILDRILGVQRYRIAIDLARVDYISSAGAGVFIGALGRAQEYGGDILLMNPQPAVLEVFDLLGLTQIFQFVKTPDEAVAYFRKMKPG